MIMQTGNRYVSNNGPVFLRNNIKKRESTCKPKLAKTFNIKSADTTVLAIKYTHMAMRSKVALSFRAESITLRHMNEAKNIDSMSYNVEMPGYVCQNLELSSVRYDVFHESRHEVNILCD